MTTGLIDPRELRLDITGLRGALRGLCDPYLANSSGNYSYV